MKKDLKKLTLVAFIVLLSSASRAAYSQSGSVQRFDQNTKQVATAKGIVQLSYKDVASMLKSQSKLTSQNSSIQMQMPAQAHSMLNKAAKELAVSFEKESQKAEAAYNSEKSKLLKQRQKLQAKRISGQNEEKAQKDLFENLLAENNIRARHEQRIAQIEREHSLTLRFVELKQGRNLQSIEVAGRALWSEMASQGRQVAKR